jgi:cell division protein FtsN
VQTGSFINKDNAEAMSRELARDFPDVQISPFETPRQVYYRVRVPAKDRETAEAIARRAMAIAAEICVYTNSNVTVESLDA